MSWDIVYRDLAIGTDHREALVIYIDGMVNKDAIQEFVIKPLTLEASMAGLAPDLGGRNPLMTVQARVVSIGELRTTGDLAEAVDRVCGGETVLFAAGIAEALVMDTRGWKDRAVQEPSTEVTIRGPREGFTETLKTGTALIRHRLKTPQLRFERTMIGDYTRTDVVLAYIEGLASRDLLSTVREKLNRIRIDSFIESEYIEELIRDQNWTILPLVQATEYPERVVAALVEGRVAVMADTTPFALILPTTFVSFLHSAEDHFQSPLLASTLRLIRLACVVVGIWASPLYVAAATFHTELIPSPLLERLVASRRAVPFGVALEILILELAFEVLREAGVRLPRPVGQAVSIVGALVLGQAAVTAGLVSPAGVIVVAFGAICSLSLPNYWVATNLRLLRYPLLALAASLGLFGISTATALILAHATSRRSFGTPYLAPLAPFDFHSMVTDGLLRAPREMVTRRPKTFGSLVAPRVVGRQGPLPEEKRTGGTRREGTGRQ
jgi:spore germination protein KA